MGWMAPRLHVKNPEASFAFYKDVLGFTEWFSDLPHSAGVTNGFGRIILHKATPDLEGKVKGTGTDLYFGMTGIDEYYEQVKERVTLVQAITDTPWGHRLFTLADPDGFHITFSQEK